MSRVLEIVLCLSLEGWRPSATGRSRTVQRDFGAELGRAWRICPQVKMRRGHERVTIEPCQVVEAEPSPGANWRTWVESAESRRVVASRTQAFAPGVTLRETFDTAHADVAVAGAASEPVSPTAPAGPHEQADGAESPSSVKSPAAAVAPGTAGVQLVCERRRGRWADDSGVSVEMTLDDMTIHDGAATRRHCELRLTAPDWGTVEARAATLRALFAAARELSGAWPAFAQLASLIDRACDGALATAAPVRARSVDLSRMTTQRDALAALAGDITIHWLGNEAGVLDHEDPEFVHQMRVALRRLRTLMRLFPHYANGGWSEAFEADLRWLAGLLGTVRDWDVFSTESLPALIEADGDSAAAWAGTLDTARAQCTTARADVRQALHSARYARLTLGWLEWLSAFALPADPAADDAPPLRQHAAKRVRRLFERLASVPPLATLDAASRHRVRIDAKRLRYALEFFASLASRHTRIDTVKTLSRVQSVLGEVNDAVVALHRLEELAAPPYQVGFVRGYAAALERHAVSVAETLLAALRPPKVGGKES
ncbi:CHAD domain-containing protein [Burkholderia guangdongensis]|uniref:CHAD domain-containing protein n=1 Tax=Burkholderia guangdongensis TaxID=1792500 RepID=UPI0015CC6253|nr:CHAD domain-containing protein [Burkholderia guangdongensis]